MSCFSTAIFSKASQPCVPPQAAHIFSSVRQVVPVFPYAYNGLHSPPSLLPLVQLLLPDSLAHQAGDARSLFARPYPQQVP
jgi:hypothetical protein